MMKRMAVVAAGAALCLIPALAGAQAKAVSQGETITVKTDDDRTVSFQVDDPKNLKGVAAGDKVEITYTTAVMITVK